MRSLVVLWIALVVVTFSFAGCGNGGGAPPPEIELFADPEVCDVPCEVVLDSGLEPAKDRPLTFTWDLGEGPVPGNARLLHTWEQAGTYTVSVTASDGQSSVTDTATVLVEAQPKREGTIDESGGAVTQGACTVSVPEGIAPESFSLVLAELPSMQDPAERAFEPDEVTALGSAYDVTMPLKPATPVSISVRDPEARGVDPSELAWLVRMVGRPLPPSDQPDLVYSPAPIAGYVLMPVTQVDEDGTAHGEIYGHKRFQLVRLDEPLHVESAVLEDDAAQKAMPSIKPIIIFKRNPSRITITNYKNAIVDGFNQSRSVLLNQLQFRGPEGAVVVYVGKLSNPKWAAFVPFFDHHTIHMSYTLASTDEVKKIFAHEFFHLIQNHYSNRVSEMFYHYFDGWFNEGTATWAMDEVYDQIQGLYYATTWPRFEIPLLEKISDDEALHAYENVGFFKWAETKNNGIIKRMLDDRYASTHVTLPGAPNPLENYTIVDHLSAFKSLWSGADFLEFTYKARYLKDFDVNETRKNEIWSTDPNDSELGKPKEVDYTTGDIVSAGSGDSEDNAVKISFEMRPNLTAEVIKVASHDLEGVLNARFTTRSEPLDARLIVLDKASYDLKAEDELRDISSNTHDLTAKMSPNEDAYLIVVDPRWDYPSSTTAKKYEVEVWIEDPCRSIGGNIVEVSTEDELTSAARTAGPGTTIKLAAGTYSPPISKWDAPEYGPFDANLLLLDTNLVGAGQGQTTLVLSGGDLAALYTHGSSKLHNLTVEAYSGSQIAALDHRDLEICNSTFNFSSNHAWGIILNPWHGGATSLYMYETTMMHPLGGTRGSGIFLQTCSSPDPVYLSATIKESRFSGWYVAVEYYTGYSSCGTHSVDTDCKGFSNNTWNVLESYCPAEGEPCQGIEHCPNP